jgi:hypothetical protein
LPDELDISNPYNTLQTDYGPEQQLPSPQEQRARPALNAAVVVLRVSLLLLLGVVILSAIATTVGNVENGGLTLKFTENPHAGETFQIDNNVFEFDDGTGVIDSHIPVEIGATVAETADNTMQVLNQYGYNAVTQ